MIDGPVPFREVELERHTMSSRRKDLTLDGVVIETFCLRPETVDKLVAILTAYRDSYGTEMDWEGV